MDDALKIILSVASGVGLGQLLLFWVTRRSRKVDTRDEKELNLEAGFLAERRELLTSLRAQLAAEQARGSRLETEKVALLRELFSLQKFANEVVAKYDFLRTLNPEAHLPAVHLDQPLPGSSPSPAPASATANPEEDHDRP